MNTKYIKTDRITARIYLAYSLKNSSHVEVANRLRKIDQILRDHGNETFIFFRDIQNWVKQDLPLSTILEIAFREIEKSDIIILDTVAPPGAKARGMSIEAGYAKGKGKKIIALRKVGDDAYLLAEIADVVIDYNEIEGLSDKLPQKITELLEDKHKC